MSIRKDFRAKQLSALAIIAKGYSLVTEIRTLLSQMPGMSPDNMSTYRAIVSLDGLIKYQLLPLKNARSIELGVVSLSKHGRKLCHFLDWPPYESEWERMKRLHEKGKSEPAHTCATLAFAYQARLRGCRAGVVPKIESPGQFAPDAIVQEDDEQVLVEVELGYEKIDKWKNMHKAQGFVALCTNSVTHRNTLKRECQSLGIPGRATDLRTLFLTSKDETPCPLWLDEWK